MSPHHLHFFASPVDASLVASLGCDCPRLYDDLQAATSAGGAGGCNNVADSSVDSKICRRFIFRSRLVKEAASDNTRR